MIVLDFSAQFDVVSTNVWITSNTLYAANDDAASSKESEIEIFVEKKKDERKEV